MEWLSLFTIQQNCALFNRKVLHNYVKELHHSHIAKWKCSLVLLIIWWVKVIVGSRESEVT